MVHKYNLKALDKTLKDLLMVKYVDNNNRPFSGMTIILGGDFRQILIMIPKGRISDII